MTCEKVLGRLSLFLDDMIEESHAAAVSLHLSQCSGCNRELMRLKSLQNQLGSLEPVEAPEYLRDLVRRRIAGARSRVWHKILRSDLEYGWSKVRTTEGKWYAIRLLGALATVVFFIAISAAVSPIPIDLSDHLAARGEMWAARALTTNLQRVFGSPLEAQKKPIRSSEPKINDEYLANFAENASRIPQDDTVSVVFMVDSSGAARVQNVLEYPVDESLLDDFTEMIHSAAFRPASQNGRAVNSPLVLTFTKIYVYN